MIFNRCFPNLTKSLVCLTEKIKFGLKRGKTAVKRGKAAVKLPPVVAVGLTTPFSASSNVNEPAVSARKRALPSLRPIAAGIRS